MSLFGHRVDELVVGPESINIQTQVEALVSSPFDIIRNVHGEKYWLEIYVPDLAEMLKSKDHKFDEATVRLLRRDLKWAKGKGLDDLRYLCF